MKQTAVEFLVEKYKSQNTLLFADDFEKAKEIEKEKKDDFAIEFSEWCGINATQKSKGLWHSISLQIALWEAKTTKELLETFKNK